jgi:hypothetical protein
MKILLLSIFLFLMSFTISAEDTIVNRMWVEIIPGNPSLWVDTQNMRVGVDVLHVVIKTKFGVPQKFRGYISPDDMTVLPLTDAVSYIISDTYINCDGSTYQVINERLFSIDDKQFFMFESTLKIPTTIDTDSPIDIIMKKYCSGV